MHASDRSAEELEIRRLAREQGRARRSAVQTFVCSVRDGDITCAAIAAGEIDDACNWRAAFSACARLSSVHVDARRWFLQFWCASGDNLRDATGDDRMLIAGLRVLLPPHEGPAVTLYRGDSMFNRRRRDYGPSWSSSEQVAQGFAEGMWRSFQGGSVLLRTVAPPEAIVCSPAMLGDEYDEQEYLVDRRRLGRVEVVRRFQQRPMSEPPEGMNGPADT